MDQGVKTVLSQELQNEFKHEMELEDRENWIRNAVLLNTVSDIESSQREVDEMMKVVNFISSSVQHVNNK